MYDKDNPLYMNPALLQESSLDYIIDNLGVLCKTVEVENHLHPETSHLKMQFKDEQTFFPCEISEKLLSKLSEQKKLDDVVMTLFSSDVTRLKHIKLKDASKLSLTGLKTLRGHKIQELEVVGLTKATVTDLISCLSEWSLQNLRVLNVTKSTFMDSSKFCIVVALSKLKNLQVLNVSKTEFSKNSLELVVADLPNLESINISCTHVTDISALRKCKKRRLKSLCMAGIKVPVEEMELVIDVITGLEGLIHLDISDVEDHNPCDALPIGTRFERMEVSALIRRFNALPILQSLDISGSEKVNAKDLIKFLSYHKLRFLGLALNEISRDPMFTDPNQPSYYGDKVITGFGTEAQILESLRRYIDRPSYISKALFFLFKMTTNNFELLIDNTVARIDIIQLVVQCALAYPTVYELQMAATACLFNLSKAELSQQIHPSILRQIVEVDLAAMENFPQQQQLQKNVLLTIYSYRILEVDFDRYRCTRLVLDCLCAWHDQHMIRMSVAICSVLAAKISTHETSELGSKENYMRKLLSIVQERIHNPIVDITLKFTLSALWNLTDDSPKPCQVFLDENGMKLYLDVLISFAGELAVETKILGLFNNIAEVKHLRHCLMDNVFITTLSVLLQSTNIEVSYFAAGIVAHLISDSNLNWSNLDISLAVMSQKLWLVVNGWKIPKDEMVAYRSFKPFFPLLQTDQDKSVQLWAVWAIHHVTSKNPRRYCKMLAAQNVHQVMLELVCSPATDVQIANICEQIIQTIVGTGFMSQQEAIRGRQVFASC